MRLPNSTQKILIMGTNGSGKSVAAVWHLSQTNFTEMPWLVLNHKREELINSIPFAEFVDLDFFPEKPGIYVYTPRADADDDAVDALMDNMYQVGHMGLYIDEGYMINPRSKALNTLYTQGRSLHIPVITLSQRPSRISRFAVTESHFYQVFRLIDKRDRKTLEAFIEFPENTSLDDVNRKLPEFHSIYYDVSKSKLEIARPVPNEDIIREIFRSKFEAAKSESDREMIENALLESDNVRKIYKI